MTPLVRGLTAGWAMLALVVLAFVDVSVVRWFVAVPVLVFGPGLVAARFVSPDDGRFRATLTAVAGLVTLVLVSEAFVIGHAFDLASIAAVLATITVIGAMAVPNATSVVATLPSRPAVDPRSDAARRFRSAAAGRSPQVVPPVGDDHVVPSPSETTPVAVSVSAVALDGAISSPTLGPVVARR